MIFDREPQDWKELQYFVGQLFTECDFDTEISKIVDLVRGKKEVDVFAQDNRNEYRPIILVECKYWNKPIKQETIHSFRTIMNDFGANLGFVISRNGFQKGAIEAAVNTNIRLATLPELEKEYYTRWKNAMHNRYRPYADRLFPYWDYTGKMPIDGGKVDYEKQKLIFNAYSPICLIGPKFENDNTTQIKYPIIVPTIDDNLEQIGKLEIHSDRQYFDFIEKFKDVSLKHFMILFREI